MSCPSVRMSAVNASGTSLEVLFDVMRCRQVGDELVLEAVTCAAAAATAWRHAATYGLLPIAGLVVAAIPSALLWLRRAHGGRLPDTHPVFGVLCECYRTERARLFVMSMARWRHHTHTSVVDTNQLLQQRDRRSLWQRVSQESIQPKTTTLNSATQTLC
jgi:hypothetical protein